MYTITQDLTNMIIKKQPKGKIKFRISYSHNKSRNRVATILTDAYNMYPTPTVTVI